jgi:lipopolysaccharide/colanic/teichoic acid biosynthesis glycosyltransferase
MRSYGNEACSAQRKIKALFVPILEALLLVSRLLALIVLAIYLPVLVVMGLLVLATSPGPAFVKRAYRRKGGAGEVVYLYEFRTECWRTWEETPVGTFLRRADLHRLPRLANVLMGEVGVGERVQRVAD